MLRHRAVFLVFCLIATGAAGFSLKSAIVASSFAKMFFGQVQEYKDYKRLVQKFVSDEVLLIGYRDPAPLSPASLERLSTAVEQIEKVKEVARVESVLTAQRIDHDGDTLRVEQYAEAAGRSPARLDQITAQLRRDSLLSSLLIGKDGKSATIFVELKLDPDRSAERIPRLVNEVLEQLKVAGYKPEHLHRAGLPALMGEIMVQTQLNLQRSLPITLGVLLVVVFALFRRLAPALLAMTIAGLAVIWTMGFARLLDRELNIFLSIVPAVILIVAFSDVIHMWSAFRIEWNSGKDKRAAIMASATDVGTACLLTSITTFIGFVCLSAIPTPVFRQMGLVLGFGVAVALLLAMTLVPIALSFIAPPPRAKEASAANAPRVMDRAIAVFSNLSTNHPKLVLAGFLTLASVAGLGISRITVDTDMAERFHQRNSYRVDQRFFNRHFAGTNTVDLFIDTADPKGLLDPKVFLKVAELQRRLEARPDVDKALSFINLVETMHGLLSGEGRLPRTREAMAQYLLLFEMSGGEDMNRLIDFKRQSMRIALRLNDHGVRSTFAVGEAGNQIGTELLGSTAKVKASGLTYLVGWWLDSIVTGQRNGLLLSIGLIGVVMILGLRSLRAGLGSMVPNILPLAALGGFLGLTVDRVDSDTLVLAMMAIGIGVDDTIHFLMRYRIECMRTTDVSEALRRTFNFSGRAIILTTIVLVFGFAPFAFSDYYSTHILGTLLPGVLVVALLADLLLVPALAQLGWLRFRPTSPGPRP